MRNTTFHYPSPKTGYKPMSDEQLSDVLGGMSNGRALMHLDHRGEHPVITLSFANEVALALAIAQHSADEVAARKQYETTSAGAVALVQWADALLIAYFELTGATIIGKPEIIDDTRGSAGSGRKPKFRLRGAPRMLRRSISRQQSIGSRARCRASRRLLRN